VRPDARTLAPAERSALEATLRHLDDCGGADPKLVAVLDVLEGRSAGVAQAWLPRGCILFSMYFDTVAWMAGSLSAQFPAEPVGVYGGGARSYVLEGGESTPVSRDDLVKRVAAGRLRLLVATDAASEGLNLQALGTVVNVDLPWNPARLEQRVGRVKRIGQRVDRVRVLNLRYTGSVEDQVHQKLSERLQDVNRIFGTLPDHLEDLWVVAALEGIEKAQQRLFAQPLTHPFKLLHDARIDTTEWDRVAQSVPLAQVQQALRRGF
jgi:ERCC4-related helicase